MTPAELANRIEHTFLKAFGTPEDVTQLCEQAITHGFAVVMVNPAELKHCHPLLEGSAVRLGTVIGFPLGQNTSSIKAFEARDAIQRGAQDLDLVLNIRALQAGKHKLIRQELDDLVKICREHDCTSKVILETCYLNDQHKRTACNIALDAGIDYVKTSTGFGSGGATLDDVRLMRSVVGTQAKIKASGGVRSLADAQALIEAGADRLGTSSGVLILEELNNTQ